MFLIMLQVTGHAGGVPIASPRGRSVEVPFEREHSVSFSFRTVNVRLPITLVIKNNHHKRIITSAHSAKMTIQHEKKHDLTREYNAAFPFVLNC